MTFSILMGILLSIIGFIGSMFSISKSKKKEDWNDFISTYFSINGIKAVFMIIMILISVEFNIVKTLPFILSLFISYIFLLFIEILYLNSQKSLLILHRKKFNKANINV